MQIMFHYYCTRNILITKALVIKAHKQLLDLHALGLNCVEMIYSWHNALFEWLYSDIFRTVTIMKQSFFIMTQPLSSYSEKLLSLCILLLKVIYIKEGKEEILVKTNKKHGKGIQD